MGKSESTYQVWDLCKNGNKPSFYVTNKKQAKIVLTYGCTCIWAGLISHGHLTIFAPGDNC